MIYYFLLLLIVTEIFFIFKLYNIKQLYILNSLLDSLITKTDNLFINAYFKSLLIFVFINLFLSIFHLNNFINFHGNQILMYCFCFIHTLFCVLYGVYKIGFKELFNNFYTVKINSWLTFFIGNFIFLLSILLDLFIKPIIISTRLVLNVFVADQLKKVLSGLPMSTIPIILLNLFKILMYLLQSYLFYIFMFSIYKHTCIKHNDH